MECILGIFIAVMLGLVAIFRWVAYLDDTTHLNDPKRDVIRGWRPMDGRELPTTRITTYIVTERDERGRLVERRYPTPEDDPSIHESPYAR